jgi:hypothetical protein
MHIVQCVYCQKKFDRDKEKFQVVSNRRYAHIGCNKPIITQDTVSAGTIKTYAGQLLRGTANFSLIAKQTKDFVARGLTYNGIFYTLKYWYEIKNNSIEKAKGGIGIVPYVYDEAKKYWEDNKPMDDIKVPKIEVEHVVIKRKPRKKLLIETEE